MVVEFNVFVGIVVVNLCIWFDVIVFELDFFEEDYFDV